VEIVSRSRVLPKLVDYRVISWVTTALVSLHQCVQGGEKVYKHI